jgi:hydrogenase maturation factor
MRGVVQVRGSDNGASATSVRGFQRGDAMPGQLTQTERVMLAHGGGGELMQRLIRERLLPSLRNGGAVNMETLLAASSSRRSVTDGAMTDSAILPWNGADLVFTTDSYVVTRSNSRAGISVASRLRDGQRLRSWAAAIAISLALILEEDCRWRH